MAVLAIFNPISGAGRAKVSAAALAKAAGRHGLEIELLPTEPTPPERWLRPVLESRPPQAMVVIGGDGAVRLAAPEAARVGVPLVHLPAGTENLFAREFRMAPDPDRVFETLLQGRTRRVDLIEVSASGRASETAVLMASFGFDAEVVHDLAAHRSGAITHLSYLRPMLRRIRRLTLPTITATLDGEIVADGVQGMVVVANSRQYASRLDPARRAVMDDGVFDLLVLPCRTVPELLGWLVRTWLGRHLRDPRLLYRQGRRLELELDPASRWQVDGDPPHDREPLSRVDFTLRPGVLNVLEPPGDANTGGRTSKPPESLNGE